MTRERLEKVWKKLKNYWYDHVLGFPKDDEPDEEESQQPSPSPFLEGEDPRKKEFDRIYREFRVVDLSKVVLPLSNSQEEEEKP